MKVYFDLETTSKEALQAEIITGYFASDSGFDYHYKSKVDKWSESAAKIHGISENEMMTYPDKHIALQKLNSFLESLPSDTEFILYANPNNMGQYYYYDKAVIEMQFCIYDQPFKFEKITSTYDLIKDAKKRGLFIPNKKRTDKGRFIDDFTLSGVYNALFGYDFNDAHNCVEDVMALVKVHNEIDKILSNNIVGGNVNQMRLL